MTATIGQIRDELQADLRARREDLGLGGPSFHDLVEEYDDHMCSGWHCIVRAESFRPNLSKVPPFVWAGGAS